MKLSERIAAIPAGTYLSKSEIHELATEAQVLEEGYSSGPVSCLKSITIGGMVHQYIGSGPTPEIAKAALVASLEAGEPR